MQHNLKVCLHDVITELQKLQKILFRFQKRMQSMQYNEYVTCRNHASAMGPQEPSKEGFRRRHQNRQYHNLHSSQSFQYPQYSVHLRENDHRFHHLRDQLQHSEGPTSQLLLLYCSCHQLPRIATSDEVQWIKVKYLISWKHIKSKIQNPQHKQHSQIISYS